MNEIKFLRKKDFPDSVVEALRVLERLCVNETTQTNPQLDLLNSVSEEFIFLEIDRRGNKRKLAPVKELQVLERLITYFSDSKNDPQSQGYVFLYLFMPGKRLSETRLSILTKLVSVAVADLNANILYFSGMWMQMSDCKSEPALYVSEVIVRDYFLFMPSLATNLKSIPMVAPLFCSSFLCCLTLLYEPLKSPPKKKITELALEWLKVCPFLCFAPLKMALPQKTYGPQTPIIGLINWCTLAPLSKIEDEELFSQLHLAVLETLLGFVERDSLIQLKLAIPYSSIVAIVDILKSYSQHDNIQLCLDRFAQAIQISLSTNCLQQTPELFNQLSLLPPTKLLKIVIDKWNSGLQAIK